MIWWTPDLSGLGKDLGRAAGFKERMKMEMPKHNGFVGIQKAENGYILYYMNREFVFGNLESAMREMRKMLNEPVIIKDLATKETKGEEDE